MSTEHPVIAVTGSSGAGTTTVRHAFDYVFTNEGIKAVFVEGNSFRRYGRVEMKRVVENSHRLGNPVSHFGPESNEFDRLEALFRDYGATGSGKMRHYIDDQNKAGRFGQEVGTFTPWESIAPGSDLLFYEGLHGGVVASTWTRRQMSPSHNPRVARERRTLDQGEARGVDIARWVDLLIGVVPIMNLEWIQKIHRDCGKKGCPPQQVTATILRRMDDYVHFIVPQFSLSDINFQRVPLVDTSNPFIAMDVPSSSESMVVVRFREPHKHNIAQLLKSIDGALMSRSNTMVIPGGEMGHALYLVCEPLVHRLREARDRARPTAWV